MWRTGNVLSVYRIVATDRLVGFVTIAVAQALQQPGPANPHLDPIAMHVDPSQDGEQEAALSNNIGC
ncbi:hypothetical protein C3941_17690 [Kaistia algarum]|nr:hypothetical protein C3941_17690 [Kaistia algarum]